jgi:hypothetical protein
VINVAYDIVTAYGLQLALWFGWPGIMAGGLFGTALFPGWRISAAIAGAVVGALLWTACWLTVALGLRMMGVSAT